MSPSVRRLTLLTPGISPGPAMVRHPLLGNLFTSLPVSVERGWAGSVRRSSPPRDRQAQPSASLEVAADALGDLRGGAAGSPVRAVILPGRDEDGREPSRDDHRPVVVVGGE